MSVNNMLVLFKEEFENEKSHGSLKGLRFASTLIDGKAMAQDDRLKRGFEGVYNQRPKYH